MVAVSAAHLLALWSPSPRRTPHRRLAALLEGAGETIEHDTLGARNRRVLALHRELIGTSIEAHAVCPHCSTDNEFDVPRDAILATPAPDVDARVEVESGEVRRAFRLPRMSDVEAAAGTGSTLRNAVIKRCALDAGGPLDETATDRLEAMFETLDPAANIVVVIACAGCRSQMGATVDIASFVAGDLDRLTDGLFRDIDTIAAAYGWGESQILELEPERRKRYVALIAARRTQARPSLAGARG